MNTWALVVALALPTLAVAQQSARESLRVVDERAGAAAYASGLASALDAYASEDVVLLYDGAPIVRGRAQVQQLLAEQKPLHELRVSWSPLRVLVSHDGSLGVTFGTTAVTSNGQAPLLNRYISVWRSEAAGSWKLIAHAQAGLTSPREFVPVAGVAEPTKAADARDPFAMADLLFAKAARGGAPVAFEQFAAPDAITFAGTGELNVGPAAIRSRLQEGPAAAATWEWHPVLTFGAVSGDLGATVGEAEIRLPNANQSSYSKYLTVWSRQADGSLKFVVDGGSARPAPR